MDKDGTTSIYMCSAPLDETWNGVMVYRKRAGCFQMSSTMLIEDLSLLEKPKRTRKSHSKVRTGCLTCKCVNTFVRPDLHSTDPAKNS
jgi:hypothetical protein